MITQSETEKLHATAIIFDPRWLPHHHGYPHLSSPHIIVSKRDHGFETLWIPEWDVWVSVCVCYYVLSHPKNVGIVFVAGAKKIEER